MPLKPWRYPPEPSLNNLKELGIVRDISDKAKERLYIYTGLVDIPNFILRPPYMPSSKPSGGLWGE